MFLVKSVDSNHTFTVAGPSASSYVKVEACEEALRACRCCLATDARLFPLHAHALADAYGQLLGAPVSPTDGLPQHLCSMCWRMLQNCIKFRARSTEVQSFLHGIRRQNSELQITTEFIRRLDTSQLKYNLNISQVEFLDIAPAYIEGDLTLAEEKKAWIEDTKDAMIDINYDGQGCGIDDDFAADSGEEFEDTAEPIKKKRKRKLDEINPKSKVKETKTKRNSVDEAKVKKIKHKTKSESKNNVQSKIVKAKGRLKKENEEAPIKKESVTKERKNTEQSKKQKSAAKGKRNTFADEEYLKEYTNKYNCDVVLLTKEQQIAEIEARKETDNYKKSNYKCELCFKGYESKLTFDKHMVGHDPASGSFECEVCHQRRRSRGQLLRHHDLHKCSFRCRLCGHRTKRGSQARLHHNFHNGFKFVCEHCGEEFDRLTTQLSHVRARHASARCALCADMFIGRRGLRMHMAKIHKQAVDSRCASCKLQFHSMDALDKHLDPFPDRVCDDTTRACVQCGCNFPTDEALECHLQEQHKNEYKCNRCQKSFKSDKIFAAHTCRAPRTGRARARPVRRVPGAEPPPRLCYMCEICGTKKISDTQLKEHMLIHTGEKPHQCTLCPKRYRLALYLQYHMNMHTGTRPYKCARCPMAFYNPTARHTHRLVHTKELRCPCPLCGKLCRSNSYVKIHIKTAHLKEAWPKRDRARGRALKQKDTVDSQSDDNE